MAIGIGTMLVGGVVGGLLQSVFPPAQDFLSKESYDIFPLKILPPAEILNLYYKNEISESQLKQYLRENGYDDDYAELLLKSGYQKLGVNDYVQAWRRGIIDEDTLDKSLKALRINDTDIRIYKQVSEYFPTPADLTTFAVREVYSPEIRSRFGLDLDRPQRYLDEARKAGLPQEQAQNYWAAHWQLPSPLQGFEMLHRQVIDSEDLSKLLKALDIVPFWREKLEQISYSPLTRVDVRRMYGLGVIDEEGVHKAYRDIGYNDDNAKLLTEFTKKYENESGNDITRAAIIKAFKKDIIDDVTTYQYLIDGGYNEDTAKFYLSMAQYEKYEAESDEYIEELKQLYLLGELTLEDVQIALNEFDLPAIQINSIMSKLKNKTSVKTKVPGKADLERWLKLNIIEEKEYYAKMLNLGYTKSDIHNYLTEITIEVDTSRRKYLPINTYVRWFSADIINESEFSVIARELRISEQDIERYVSEVQTIKYAKMELEE